MINLVSGDESPLNMHGGICWGEIQFLRVGNEIPEPGRAMFMMAGHCVEDAGKSLEETTLGQVKVFNSGEVLLSNSVIDIDETSLTAYSEEMTSSLSANHRTNLPGFTLAYTSLLSHQRIFAELNKKSKLDMTTDDIRTVSVMFVSLPDLEADYNDVKNQR